MRLSRTRTTRYCPDSRMKLPGRTGGPGNLSGQLTQKKSRISRGEFLGGFYKEDRLLPVIILERF